MQKNITEIEKYEVERTDCFLCNPNESLVYYRGPNAFAMSGLGSISPGYSIVATKHHLQDLSALSEREQEELKLFVECTREKIATHYGNCILTEHGKMPVCNSEGSAHCFHPHFLLFPNSSDITNAAKKYFDSYTETSDFSAALIEGQKHKNYYLISPKDNQYFIFPSDEDLPRQFLRVLVAEKINLPELANWRMFPNIDEAIKTSKTMRAYFHEK